MKPLTRYDCFVRDDDFGTTAVMEAWSLGGYYAKYEADDRIAELVSVITVQGDAIKANIDGMELALNRIAALEAERDAAKEEADRRTREVEATCLVQKRLTEERDWLRIELNCSVAGVGALQRAFDEAKAERDAARADAERNRANAERYEWLRRQSVRFNLSPKFCLDTLDAAIDAARRKE